MSMTAPLVVRQGSGGAAPGPNGELPTQFTRRSPHQDYALCSTKKGKDLVAQPSGETVNTECRLNTAPITVQHYPAQKRQGSGGAAPGRNGEL